jgi:hypothetical protein
VAKAEKIATQFAEEQTAVGALATQTALGTPVVYTPIPIPTDAPVPTPVSGITGCGAAYKGFYPGGCWAEQGNGEYVFVSAGAFTNAMEQGVIQVMTSTLDQRHFSKEQTYQTPDQVGMVYPASVVWPRMTLVALPDTGPTRTFVFNMLTHSWEAPGPCRLYPLALHMDTIQGLRPHYGARTVQQGVTRGAFGWLSWQGDRTDAALANSLTVPGDSETYANPDNPADHVLAAGKWVRGRPAVSNPSNVVTALTRIQTDHFFVTVPVWDQTTGTANTFRYHIASFAWVSLDNIDAANPNQLTIRYWGQAICPPNP